MKWYAIIITVICAGLLTYLIIKRPKIEEIPIQVFKPDTLLIREVVNLKAEKAILETENEKLKNKINAFHYKEPVNINGSDSDLARAFRATISKIR